MTSRGTQTRQLGTERCDPLAPGPVEERLAPQRQRIKEQAAQRQLHAHRLDVELAPEAAHRDLERLRPPVRPERDRLAVDDQLRRWQRSDDLDHLRHRAGHLVELAGEHPDLVAALWTCIRAPSSFHSNAASPSCASASSASSAGCASIGCTGRNS